MCMCSSPEIWQGSNPGYCGVHKEAAGEQSLYKQNIFGGSDQSTVYKNSSKASYDSPVDDTYM